MSQVYLNERSLVPSIHEFCKKFGEVIDGLPNVEGHIVTYLKGAVAGLPEVEAPFVRPRKFQLFREENPKDGSLRCPFFHMAAAFFLCPQRTCPI